MGKWHPPATRAGTTWQTAIDTYDPARPAAAAPLRAAGQLTVSSRSIAVLRVPRPPTAPHDRAGKTTPGLFWHQLSPR